MSVAGGAVLVEWAWQGAALVTIGAAGAYLTAGRWARPLREGSAHTAIGRILRRWGLFAAAALVFLALVRVVMRTGAATSDIPTFDAMQRVVSATLWGTGWWMQLYVALLAVAGLLIAGRRPRQGWSLAAAAALGVAYTVPMTRDDGAAVLERLPLVLAAVHVFGVGIWVGVSMLLAAGRRAGVTSAGLVAAARWTLGTGAGLAIASGLSLAAVGLDGFAAVTGSMAGRLLLLKAVAAVAAAALAVRQPSLALAAAGVAMLLTVLM